MLVLSSIFLAAGPAYSFIIGNSSYNRDIRPYLDDYKTTSLFPDLGIGYYNYHLDAAVNISSRFYSVSLSGFDVYQKVNRTSFGLELYRFVGDYHGFVPFIGPILTYEIINGLEIESGKTVFNHGSNFLSGGVIVGWDIRPKRTDWWGIRTNIRYFPFLKLPATLGKHLDLQQIELNFLQLILYPGRFNAKLK